MSTHDSNSVSAFANESSTGDPVLLRQVGPYTAYAVDLELLWRWEIYHGADQLVQDGGSISLSSAKEAVDHVLAYFSARDADAICGAGSAG